MTALLTPTIIKKILLVFYAVGILGFSLPQTQQFFIVLTPLALTMNILFLLYFHKPVRWGNYALMLLVAVLGFFIEVIGVKTGSLFGEYTYGSVLGPKMFDTPFFIGLNWLVLTYTVAVFMRKYFKSHILIALLGALLVTLFDVVMEPIAIYTGMWSWQLITVPMQNYLMWFIIAFVFIFIIADKKINNPMAGFIFLLQLGFFACMNVVIKIWYL